MMIDERSPTTSATMRAVRLHSATGPGALVLEQVGTPRLREGDALVRVHAAAVTRCELEWPADRLPAIPSYDLSGVVVALAPGVGDVSIGEAVYALAPFERDGAAAEYTAVPADVLAPKPRTLDHVESAAIPLAALSAWQGLFDHGRLESGQRVLVQGASGGVGHFAVQLARRHGAHVIGTASPANLDSVLTFGAHEVLDHASDSFDKALEPVELVFDTVGGALLARATALVRDGGRIVSIAEEPPEGVDAVYFVVQPNRQQLIELARLVDAGELRPALDSVFPLSDARAAFERSLTAGKRGKVVLRVVDQ
jgi:NADPH:quinone reductase-like Zn-dependent oxidoreductase